MKDSFDIKNGNHFKLWIGLKDKVIFENMLIEKNVPFHIDENQSTLSSDIRYFFQDESADTVDTIIKSANISASTDTIQVYNTADNKKIYKIYFFIVIAIVILLYITSLLLN